MKMFKPKVHKRKFPVYSISVMPNGQCQLGGFGRFENNVDLTTVSCTSFDPLDQSMNTYCLKTLVCCQNNLFRPNFWRFFVVVSLVGRNYCKIFHFFCTLPLTICEREPLSSTNALIFKLVRLRRNFVLEMLDTYIKSSKNLIQRIISRV